MAFLSTFVSGFFKSKQQKEAEFEHTRILLDEQAIQTAIQAHDSWKTRFLASIQGQSSEVFDPNIVCFDNHCELGHWLHTSGKTNYTHHPKFSELVSHHKMFHFAASNALALHHRGKTEEAQTMLTGQLAQYSAAMERDLCQLKASFFL